MLVFSTIKYTDTNKNGFIDELSFDLDGDTLFEREVGGGERFAHFTAGFWILARVCRVRFLGYVWWPAIYA